MAKARMQEALSNLRRNAESRQVFEPTQLEDEALRLLQAAEARVEEQVRRNVFVGERLLRRQEGVR